MGLHPGLTAAPDATVPGVARDLYSRAGALITRHRPFAVALAAGAVLRVVAALGYPGALWFSDSFVYIGDALRPQPDPARAVGYSFFLRALEPFHSLALVTGLQHMMGLGIAVMIYAAARRGAAPQRWACVAALPVLLDGFELEDEHMIMAETLFTFLAMLAMLLILRRGRVPWQSALLAGVIIGCAVDVRTEGLPLLILFPAFLLLRGPDRRPARQSGRSWMAAGTMILGCAVPVLAYLGWYHAATSTYALTRADGFYLWGRVSSFAECPVIRPPAAEQKLCPSGPPSSRTPPGHYIWHAPQVLGLPGGPVSASSDALLRDFAFRAIEAQPLGYLRSVLSGLALSVQWPRQPYPDADAVYFYHFHQEPQVIPAGRSWVPGGTPFLDAVRYGRAAPSRVVPPFAAVTAWYERWFFTYGPLFGLILLTGLGGVVRIRRTPPCLTWCRRAGGMLPWTTAIVLLVFPVAVADFDYRYLLPVLPFACLAAALAFAPVVPAAAPAALRERPAPYSPPGPGPAEGPEP
jgi:hypothetical protein